MAEPATVATPMYFDLDAVTAAAQAAVRDARLEHARLGRPVCEGRNGQVVWLTPAEVFALYGLDEFGREPATSPPRPTA